MKDRAMNFNILGALAVVLAVVVFWGDVFLTEKMVSLIVLATIGAILATLVFWWLTRIIGGKDVIEKIKKMESSPRDLAIYLAASKCAIFYLFATILTRF